MAEQETAGKKTLKIQRHLEDIRQPYQSLMQDAIDMALPRRGNITNPNEPEGQKKGQEIYDNTAVRALNLWADGIQGYHISPSIPWFRSRLSDRELRDDSEVKKWLEACDECIYYALSRSNTFYPSFGDFLRDGGAPGNATMFIEEDIDSEKVETVVPNPREVFVKRNPWGQVVRVHRKFKMTAEDAIAEFDGPKEGNVKGALSDNVKNSVQHNNNPYTTFEFIHAVYRNPDWIRAKQNIENARYLSEYVQVQGEKVVRRLGYNVLNPVVWGLRRSSGTDYGRGIVGDAICTVLEANAMAKGIIQGVQMIVQPPWNIPEDQRDEADLSPGGRNYYKEAGRVVSPVMSRMDYPFGAEERKEIQRAIEEQFSVRFFLLLSETEKAVTAYEIMQKQGEKAALMGPQLGELNGILDMIMDCVFDIERRAGRLPKIPDRVLKESTGHIDLEYIGPLAQAQKRLFKTQGVLQGLEASRPIFEVFPQTVDRIHPDRLIDEVLDGCGFPEKIRRSDDEVEEVRQARAAEQEAQEALVAGAAAADAVPKLSKKVEEGSPLAAIAGAA